MSTQCIQSTGDIIGILILPLSLNVDISSSLKKKNREYFLSFIFSIFFTLIKAFTLYQSIKIIYMIKLLAIVNIIFNGIYSIKHSLVFKQNCT